MQDPVRPKVRAIIESLGSPASRIAIAAASDLTSNQLSNALYGMQQAGELTRSDKDGVRMFSINPDYVPNPIAAAARKRNQKKQYGKKSASESKPASAPKPKAPAPAAPAEFPPSITTDKRLVLPLTPPVILSVEQTLAVAELIGVNFDFA